MGGGNRIPPRGGNELEPGKLREAETSRERGEGVKIPETRTRDTELGKAADRDEARFGGEEVTATLQREYINFQRIAGADGVAPRPAKHAWMEFPRYLRDLSLFGARVHRIAFSRPGTQFTIGSKPSKDVNYRNLSGNAGLKEQELYGVRDGMLHLRSRVEDLGTRGPQFLNLFKNTRLRPEQAVLEERQGDLILRNRSRDPVVWILKRRSDGVGKEWVFVPPGQELALEDGAMILFGEDPAAKPGSPFEPSEQTVLRVERHRDSPKDPYRWNLIEFVRLDPAQLEKIPDPGEYLAALLGQSPEWTRWRFKDVLQTLQEIGWTQEQSRALMRSVVAMDPQQAEIRLAQFPKLLLMANCIGWSPNRLLEILFQGPVAKRFGLGVLEHLPKFLEELSRLGFHPEQSAALVEHLARLEPAFPNGLEQALEFLRQWREDSAGEARFGELLAFFDRTRLSMAALRGFLSGIPGGLGIFFRGLIRILPELRERWALEGNLAARIGLEIFLGPTGHNPAEFAAPETWLPQAIDAIPMALEIMFRLNFGLLDARAILRAAHREQGAGFARWWQNIYEASRIPNDRLRKNLERYLLASEADNL
ncbi:MAG: hypothetical protein U1F66_00075 [bacterium]